LNAAVDRLENQLGDARRRTDETERTLQEVREKARQSWKKICTEVERLIAANSTLRQELAELRQELAEAREQSMTLKNRLADVATELSQNRQRVDTVVRQLESAGARLAVLERPRGWSALIQRLRGKNPAEPTVPPPSIEEPGEGSQSDTP
jgi:chromosome segregation ATPase